jgi:type VI protein secretion system component VasF
MSAEQESLRREGEKVWGDFDAEKEKQLTADAWWFRLWMALIAVTYLLLLSRFNVRSQGLAGLYDWLLSLLRYT